MSVQFFHNNKVPRYTAALDVDFERSDLVSLLANQNDMSLTANFAMTFVHPKDSYNKKIGREVCLENMEEIDLSLLTIRRHEGFLIYDFMGEHKGHPVFVVLRTSGKSNKPHLITVY